MKDTRIVVGARCTWWGPIAYTKSGPMRIPVCPECLGPLVEYANEEMFWQAVDLFEQGGPGVKRPHPGYRKFQEWLKRRCFADTIFAAAIYKSRTGEDVDIKVEDWEKDDEEQADEVLTEGENAQQEEWPDVVGDPDGEGHAQICENE